MLGEQKACKQVCQGTELPQKLQAPIPSKQKQMKANHHRRPSCPAKEDGSKNLSVQREKNPSDAGERWAKGAGVANLNAYERILVAAVGLPKASGRRETRDCLSLP